VRTLVPEKILKAFFPSKYAPFAPGFVTIDDPIAQKPLRMYVREDSMMERIFLSKGLYGNWEKESLKIWAELSKRARTVIDIGANTGIYTLIAQNNNPLATVIAIEPVKTNFNVLLSNLEHNAFPARAEQVALSDTEGTAKMYMLKDRLNYMTSVNDNRYALHPEIQGDSEVIEIEVPVKPFSYIRDKYGLEHIDLIKIDVEGHETQVLNSLAPYISQWKPAILVEIIGDQNAETLNRLFKNIGYSFVSINETGKSVVTAELWDNDHHNFLVCPGATISFLRQKGLVA